MIKEFRSEILAGIAKELKDLPELEVEKGETRALSYQSKELKPLYQEFSPKSVDELKEVVGVPDKFAREKSLPDLRSRALAPRDLDDDSLGEDKRVEARVTARRATELFLYGNSNNVIHLKPLINRFLVVSKVVVFIPFFRNITVANGATLTIAPNTLVVWANRIRLFGSGKIVCEGPTTFDCNAMEGNL